MELKSITLLALMTLVNMAAAGRFLDQVIRTDFKSCTTYKSKPGRCVPDSHCNEYKEIVKNGNIDKSELRIFRSLDCDNDEWCCLMKTDPKVNVPESDTAVIWTHFKSCTTNKGEPGRCVLDSMCNENKTIVVHGIIIQSEMRSLECGKDEWCCLMKTDPKVNVPESDTADQRCKVTTRPDCPWCVNLYRTGDDNNRRITGFYCMGAMIGSKVVLTTGTCVLQSKGKYMWARIPNSVDPTTHYYVVSSKVHPEYNSGTRANDLALLKLENEVAWGPAGPNGACIGINYALSGDECMGAGIDDDENVYMKALQVEKGLCPGLGGTDIDASCAHSFDTDTVCPLIAGSPIMCRVGDNFILTGLAKVRCLLKPPRALLGNLNEASGWITSTLKEKMGLNEKNFLFESS